MTPDQEHEIRRALHDRVQHVTPDRLRHIDAPRSTKRSTPRTRWAVVGPIAAAACVALIAVAITLATSGDNTEGPSVGERPGSLRSLIGTAWTLASVQEDGHATVAIPRRLNASVTFERGGVLSAQDGVNNYRATYKLRSAGDIVIADAGGTAAGYGGNDPARLAAINGIGAILYTADGQATPHPVSVQRRPDQLQLSAHGYTLVLGGEVAVAPSSAPPLSSTSTR